MRMYTQKGISMVLALVWLGALVLAAGAGTYYYQNYYQPSHHATVQGHGTPDGLTPPALNTPPDGSDSSCPVRTSFSCLYPLDGDDSVLIDGFLNGTWTLVSQIMQTPAGDRNKEAHGHTITFDVENGIFTEDFSTETMQATVVPNPAMNITNECRGEGAISGTFENVYTPASTSTPEIAKLKVRSVTSNTAKTICESNTGGPASTQEMKTPPTFPITMSGPSGSQYKIIWPVTEGTPSKLIITTTMPNGIVVKSVFTQMH